MIAKKVIHEFLDLSCLTYSANESPRRIQLAVQQLKKTPDISSANAYTAAATGNATALTYFMQQDATLVNKSDGPRNWPPLLYLCYSRIPERQGNGDFRQAAKLLLENGADPNAYFMWGDTYRFTALTGVIGEGEQGVKNQPPHEHAWDLALMLLDAGADPNDAQGLYNTMFTADNRWLELLIDRGLRATHEINWKSDKQTTTMDFILGHAVQHGFAERVELLLKNGANPNSRNYYDKRDHVTNAMMNGFTSIAELLQRYGAQPATLSTTDAFRAACMRGDQDTARSLLAENPRLITDSQLLSDAAGNGLTAAVRLLIDLGAEINAPNHGGNTALHQAAWRGDIDMARILLTHGAKLQRDTAHHATPVGWADFAGRREMVEFLLEYTEDIFDLVSYASPDALRRALDQEPNLVNAEDGRGNAPVHYVGNGRQDAVEILGILAKHGANLNAKNAQGKTLLDIARLAGADEIVDFVREWGATSA